MAPAMLTREEVQAYLEEQGLPDLLQSALNQVVQEKAPNAAARIGELLKKAGNDRQNTLKLKELFSTADSNGNGFIDINELRQFQQSMGEPLDDEALEKAFAEMGGTPTSNIGFQAFATWYQNARAKGGQLSKKGEAAKERKARAARRSRASRESLEDVAAGFDIAALKVVEKGEPKTLEYRVGLHVADAEAGGELKQISPWHDIPLYPQGSNASVGEVHMVVEIPKYSRAKFEIATGEDANPIKQDVKKGRLREYTYGDMCFNYGAFPQTWEDPSHTTPDTGAAGDNDPIDAVEIGTKIFPTGAVVRVKVLGCLAMIDDGETDWKVICINVDDPLATQLDDIADVERLLPGYVSVLREWLRLYKTVDDKPANSFGLEEKAMDKAYTMAVVEETHTFWQQLIAKGQKTV